ncbi:HTH_Tnp_Tc3_2 domain-containing protein [Trichonephila clavipes]|nr:HTH_Tnp_Tc3_2 domain-containing protein [Trichonephila clavipes]
MIAHINSLLLNEIANLLRDLPETESDGGKLTCSNLDSDEDIRLSESDIKENAEFQNDFMRDRIIGRIEEGRKITDVPMEFNIAHSVVSRLWKSFKTTGMCSRRHGGGRVRSTTLAEDRYILLSAKRNRRTTAQQVANQFLAASGKQISRKTVARRLRG